MPGQGTRSTFTVGLGFGLWLGLLSAFQIPYTRVRPGVWKRALGLPGKDKELAPPANSAVCCPRCGVRFLGVAREPPYRHRHASSVCDRQPAREISSRCFPTIDRVSMRFYIGIVTIA
jgi:hypothetical protein